MAHYQSTSLPERGVATSFRYRVWPSHLDQQGNSWFMVWPADGGEPSWGIGEHDSSMVAAMIASATTNSSTAASTSAMTIVPSAPAATPVSAPSTTSSPAASISATNTTSSAPAAASSPATSTSTTTITSSAPAATSYALATSRGQFSPKGPMGRTPCPPPQRPPPPQNSVPQYPAPQRLQPQAGPSTSRSSTFPVDPPRAPRSFFTAGRFDYRWKGRDFRTRPAVPLSSAFQSSMSLPIAESSSSITTQGPPHQPEPHPHSKEISVQGLSQGSAKSTMSLRDAPPPRSGANSQSKVATSVLESRATPSTPPGLSSSSSRVAPQPAGNATSSPLDNLAIELEMPLIDLRDDAEVVDPTRQFTKELPPTPPASSSPASPASPRLDKTFLRASTQRRSNPKGKGKAREYD